jgi:hypothetical protein
MTDVEQCRGGLAQCWRAVCSRPEMDVTPAVVAEIQLGKSRLIAARKCGFGAALFLQPRERELDVLTGAELARRIIRTRAKIAARSHAAYRHAVVRFGGGIVDAKLGKKRFARQILEPEGLLSAKLAA